MVKLALLALLLTGCFDDQYRCTSNAQCDVGEDGRCEIDGHCTARDTTCSTHRRYMHAGELTGTCFDDRVVLANACAAGQAPARPDGCFASVCERVPACCEVGWTDACVQLAQEECALHCDTRLAITATRGQVIERYELRWDGARWQITPHADVIAWVAPAPGDVEPRLASITGDELVVGETHIAMADRTIGSITSASVARDGRDTIVVTYETGTESVAETISLDTLTSRFAPILATTGLMWGDVDRDPFPDPIVRAFANYYLYPHDFALPIRANVTGGNTPGAPPLRSVESMDFDGDHLLDVIAFGTSIRIHTAPEPTNVAQLDLDCDPPSVDKPCMDPQNEPDFERTSFGGTTLPTALAPSLVATVFPGRKLFRIDSAAASRLPFPGDNCACTARCNMTTCPGPDCTCTYDCNACTPILAVVARDLDGDQLLDLVAIDARLQIYNALAPDFAFSAPTMIAPATANFTSIDVSVSGAPIP
jgi:hypothetical protein